MNVEYFDLLRRSVDKTVKITFTDGEVQIVSLISVSEEECDIVYDLISSNRTEVHGDRKAQAFLARFEEIVVVEPDSENPK